LTFQSPPPLLFHAEGIEAELTGHADDRCLLRLRLTSPGDPAPNCLQVVLQPADQRGLARGFPVVIAEAPLRFSTVLGGDASAFVWLPTGVSFDLAQGCYYRILRAASPSLKANPSDDNGNASRQ
jgi:hypothetical protein